MTSATLRAKPVDRCESCGTDRFKITRSFCNRCSYCKGKIERLKSADPKNPSSLLKTIPKGGFVGGGHTDPTIIHGYGPGYWADQFEKDRAKMIREFKSRLRYLKETEERLRGERPISYLHILSQFRQLAHWSGCPRKKRILNGISLDLMEIYTSEQRLFLFRWLNEIAESTNRRWKSFHASCR